MKKVFLAFLAFMPAIIISAQNPTGRTRTATTKTRPVSETTGLQKNTEVIKNIFLTSLKQQNLKGKVKSIYEIHYLASRNEKSDKIFPDSSTMEWHLIYFDKEGNEILDSFFIPNTTEYTLIRFKYASPGKLIEVVNYVGKEFDGRSSYEYDENGFIIKETEYKPGSEQSREITFREYEFADANNYSYKKLRADRKKVLSCHRYSILPDGRLKMYSNGCDTVNYNLKHIYTYGPGNKNLLRYDHYSSPGKLSSHTEYDNKGNEVKYVCDYCIEGASGKIKTFEYPSYDAAGNWTKKIAISDNDRKYLRITERTISYY